MSAGASTRFAHKPVDEHHRARLVCLGGWWLCRGCSALWVGAALAVLGAVGAGWVPSLPIGVGLLAVAAALSHPRAYRRLPNPGRDAVRAAAGAAVPWCVLGAWRAGNWVDAGIAAWAALVLSRAVIGARRRERRS
ncbi:MAG: hypothetical protein IT196_15785 [Acidimicrobiales bacterium]|nr:hypothetical protein [Acidimicrobiales bacterium]